MIYFLLLGILIQLLGPFIPKLLIILIRKRPFIGQKIVKYISPQRSYDIVTIISALICFIPVYPELILHVTLNNNNHVFGIILCGLLGGLFPLSIWKFYKRKIVFNGMSSINKDLLVFLPLTAASEELIWRYCVPFLLIMLFPRAFLVAIIVSSVGFIILHLPLGRLNSISYISLFTIIVVVSFLFFGILASVAFHIAHNLTLSLFRTTKIKTAKFQNPILSETEW